MKHTFPRAKGGFTLVEILVVLAIVALLSSIVFGAFQSVRQGNSKASCQSNLVQIYQATRLYGQDFNGELPYLNAGAVASPVPQNGLGLWALYSYSNPNYASGKLDCDNLTNALPSPDDAPPAAPLASYIKSPNVFHCPLDSYKRTVANTGDKDACKAPANSQLTSDVLQYTGTDGKTHFNPFYLSYQNIDDANAVPIPGGEPAAFATPIRRSTYSSFRAPGTKRQLIYYTTPTNTMGATPIVNPSVRSADTTIVAWCRFHRALDDTGTTIVKPSNFDNVLFLDGTVQYLPTSQKIGSANCTGYQRFPLEIAAKATSADCQ